MTMNKRNVFLWILAGVLCFSALEVEAQSPSAWLSSQARESNFPADNYIWGFVPGNLRSGETESSLLARLKTDAKKEVAGKVRTMVESDSRKTDWQYTNGEDYAFASLYQDYTRQTAQAEVVGVKTETHYDAYERMGYAFAYVKKSELAAYYKSQINIQLQQVQNALNTAATAANAGQKMRAKKACEDALQPLAKAEFAQDLLSAISPYETDALQLERLSRLKNELWQALIDLEQSIYIYMKYSETNFGQPVRILVPELKRLLASNQCSFTEDPAQADYKITITATTRQHDGNVAFGDGTLKFSLADVEVEVYSNYKKMVVYSDGITQKNNSDGATYESAGRNALKLSAGKVWENIKPWILGK